MHAPSSPASDRAPIAPPALPLFIRVADYAMMTLAVSLSVVSVVLFAWSNRPVLVPLGMSVTAGIWWNALVSFAFFAQHSIMVRQPVRARLAAIIPARYDGTFYAIASGLALALVVVLWQPAGEPLFVLRGVPRLVVRAAALLAIAGFAWGASSLRG